MNGLALALLVLSIATQLSVPRRWAPLPLLLIACYFPYYATLDLGPVTFTAIRVLIVFGLLRTALRKERLAGDLNSLDRTMIAWSAWMAISAVFHEGPLSSLIYHLGLVLDAFGIYILLRCWFVSVEDVAAICKALPLLLLPLALEMLQETMTYENLFHLLGGDGNVLVRNGRIRARGPFGHPILAGTAAASLLPLVLANWKASRKASFVGICSCFAIIYASGSSGPILTAVAGIFVLMLWRRRHLVRLLRRLAIPTYIALALVMKDPVYYLIARVDLAGGSTSWYRARMIESGIEHLPEWWLYGTDYTRHWMWVVVSWSPNHTDITSHYLQMGVWGGLLLLTLFIATLASGFYGIHRVFEDDSSLVDSSGFMIWALGASLFALTVTGLSVNFFDQTILFLYFPLAAIGSIWSSSIVQNEPS